MSDTRPSRPRHLAVIEQANELDGRLTANGLLVLARVDRCFDVMWTPVDNSSQTHVIALLQDLEMRTDAWGFGTFMNSDCRQIASFSFTPDQEDLLLTITHSTHPLQRIFRLYKSRFPETTRFIEQLVVNGIAVPSRTDDTPYLLQFYSRVSIETYQIIMPYIQLHYQGFQDLDAFWLSVHQFFLKIIVYLEGTCTLPHDRLFPLADAAAAANYLVLEKASFSELPALDQITEAEWPSLFDSDGRLKDARMFRRRAFAAGIEKSALKGALPFVFGVYPEESTLAERTLLEVQLAREYACLDRQATSMIRLNLLQHNAKLGRLFQTIYQDVKRTDRDHSAFRQIEGAGQKMLTTLLRAYCLYDPSVGYLQGMNDLFVPIILTYFPDWNAETGDPIDASGESIDVNSHISMIFWNFAEMLRRTNHVVMLSNVTEQYQEKARVIARIVKKVSPLVELWMRRNDVSGLVYLYPEFVLLFKRSIPEIWNMWIQMCCAPAPAHWFLYFVAAILLKAFPRFAYLPEVDLPDMMDVFASFFREIDHTEIRRIVLWLYEQYPLGQVEHRPEPPAVECFEFFDLEWWHE